MTWWDSRRMVLQTYDHEHTIRLEMYNMKIFPKTGSEEIEIFLGYGFKQIETPELIYQSIDPRRDLQCLKNKTADDVIAYDEVNCAEFLRQSKQNILLKFGDKWFAYDRTFLLNYLLEHSLEYR